MAFLFTNEKPFPVFQITLYPITLHPSYTTTNVSSVKLTIYILLMKCSERFGLYVSALCTLGDFAPQLGQCHITQLVS